MLRNRLKHSVGYVSGEWKLAITLRILAGGSYLDTFLWTSISCNHAIDIKKAVCRDWLCNDKVMKIDIYGDVLSNDEAARKIGSEFSEKT